MSNTAVLPARHNAVESVSKRMAGRILGYSPKQIKRLVQGGELVAAAPPKPGATTRILRSSIDDAAMQWGGDGGKTITPEQAADMLCVSVRTIRRYVSDGKLDAVQRGKGCYLRLRLKQVVKLQRNW